MPEHVKAQSTCIQDVISEETILAIWSDRIEALARKVTHEFGLDKSVAEDFAQEARLRVLRLIREGRPLTPAYVHTAIKNSIWTSLKIERRHADAQIISPLAELRPKDEPIDRPSYSVAVWLPESLRAVYRLLYVESRTQEEAGVILNLSQARVAQLNRKLLGRMKEDLA